MVSVYMFVCLFALLLYVPSQQLWSWRDGQFTQWHFFLGKLEQAVNEYFVHILSLVTDNNPSEMIQRKAGEWPYNLFHNQSPRKYETRPGLNSRLLDLQSDSDLLPDTVPTALRGAVPVYMYKYNKNLFISWIKKDNGWDKTSYRRVLQDYKTCTV